MKKMSSGLVRKSNKNSSQITQVTDVDSGIRGTNQGTDKFGTLGYVGKCKERTDTMTTRGRQVWKHGTWDLNCPLCDLEPACESNSPSL